MSIRDMVNELINMKEIILEGNSTITAANLKWILFILTKKEKGPKDIDLFAAVIKNYLYVFSLCKDFKKVYFCKTWSFRIIIIWGKSELWIKNAWWKISVL